MDHGVFDRKKEENCENPLKKTRRRFLNNDLLVQRLELSKTLENFGIFGGRARNLRRVVGVKLAARKSRQFRSVGMGVVLGNTYYKFFKQIIFYPACKSRNAGKRMCGGEARLLKVFF